LKRLLAGAAVLAAAGGAGVAGSAIGQGTGGTLGAKAVGKQTVEVRIKESSANFGANCPDPKKSVRECERDESPRIASVAGGNGAIYVDDRKVGTAYFSNVVAKRGKSGADLFNATLVFSDGTITLQGSSLYAQEDNQTNSITGGTGAYAGARGVEAEEMAPGGSRREFRVKVTLTFIS